MASDVVVIAAMLVAFVLIYPWLVGFICWYVNRVFDYFESRGAWL